MLSELFIPILAGVYQEREQSITSGEIWNLIEFLCFWELIFRVTSDVLTRTLLQLSTHQRRVNPFHSIRSQEKRQNAGWQAWENQNARWLPGT